MNQGPQNSPCQPDHSEAFPGKRKKGQRGPKTSMAPDALLAGPKDLARILNISLVSVHRRNSDGTLPKPIKIGNSVGWLVSEIKEWLEAGAPPRDVWEDRKAGGLKPFRACGGRTRQ